MRKILFAEGSVPFDANQLLESINNSPYEFVKILKSLPFQVEVKIGDKSYKLDNPELVKAIERVIAKRDNNIELFFDEGRDFVYDLTIILKEEDEYRMWSDMYLK